MQASRDDFVIAIRSAFLKKENKQKFSLLALIFLTFLILVSEKFKLKPIDYLKISLRTSIDFGVLNICKCKE